MKIGKTGRENLGKSNIRCLVINLDRSTDRMRHMEKVLGDLCIPFERVSAVDQQQISDEVFKSNTVHKAGRLTALTTGEYACGLSHRLCFEMIVAGDDEYVMVLEDDIHLAENAEFVLTRSDWIPDGVDVVKIETGAYAGNRHRAADISIKRAELGHGFHLAKLYSVHLGTGGYIISRPCAARLLEITKRHEEAIDVMMFDPTHGYAAEFNIHQVTPALCIQDELLGVRRNPDLSSTLRWQREMVFKKERPKGLAKILREIKRPFVKSYDMLSLVTKRAFLRVFRGRTLEVVQFFPR